MHTKTEHDVKVRPFINFLLSSKVPGVCLSRTQGCKAELCNSGKEYYNYRLFSLLWTIQIKARHSTFCFSVQVRPEYHEGLVELITYYEWQKIIYIYRFIFTHIFNSPIILTSTGLVPLFYQLVQ